MDETPPGHVIAILGVIATCEHVGLGGKESDRARIADCHVGSSSGAIYELYAFKGARQGVFVDEPAGADRERTEAGTRVLGRGLFIKRVGGFLRVAAAIHDLRWVSIENREVAAASVVGRAHPTGTVPVRATKGALSIGVEAAMPVASRNASLTAAAL